MKRTPVEVDVDVDSLIEQSGVAVASRSLPDGSVHRYWDESSVYLLNRIEATDLIQKISPIVAMGREAVDFLLEGYWGTLGLSKRVFEFARNSFDDGELEFYTRYDFAYLRNGNVKLVGIEADASRGLVETAYTQREWLYRKFAPLISRGKVTQLNSIPELSVEAFRRLLQSSSFNHMVFSDGSSGAGEDAIASAFISSLAREAGWLTSNVQINDLKWSKDNRAWLADGEVVTDLFKYYPWDLLLKRPIGRELLQHSSKIELVFEPAWKMILGNRAILPALYELYPESDILSPAFIDDPNGTGLNVVSAPLQHLDSRNEMAVIEGRSFTSWGEQNKDFSNKKLMSYRKLEIPRRWIDNSGGYRFTYLSVYTVAGNLAGIAFRETRLPLLGVFSTFKPHIVTL